MAASTQAPPATGTRWETNRVEAFSDAVFAIAITLLVLEIKVDPAEYEHLARALVHEWPAYLAYVTSFLTVGSVWIAHHRLFSHLRYVDPVLLRLNLVLLMAAAFLPFPTAVLAQSFHAPTVAAERVAVAFYGAVALLIEVLLRTSVRYAASRPGLASGEVHADVPIHLPSRERGWRSAVGSALYSVAIVFGIVLFPRVSAAAYLAVAVRGVFVVGGEGRLIFHRRRTFPDRRR
jgi:uncharacterized membrane protein